MKRLEVVALAAGLLSIALGPAPLTAAGLATRDLNPMLQPLFLPTNTQFSDEDGWRIDHSLFVTNTLQENSKSGESLVIDVENYRYQLDLGYRENNWRGWLSLPLTSNDTGELDRVIEDWHDLFSLPQGKRDEFPRDKIDIEYVRDGIVEYSQTESSNGIGDIALALGYQARSGVVYFAGIELPTGSESDFSGNEAVDFATWLTAQTRVDSQVTVYGMLGLGFPGDDGKLKDLLADHIWAGQIGIEYRFDDDLVGILQFDAHSRTLKHSDLKPFGNSLQMQLGLGFANLFDDHRLDLFFSEDILVGSAPDISFGLRLAREF